MTLLREVSGVQSDAGLRRRWFAGYECNLFVWEDSAGDIVAFQFCYETRDGEEAVEWRRDREVKHAVVIEQSVVGKNRSHGLQFDCKNQTAFALNIFNACSGKLEARIVDFVRKELGGEVDDLRKLGGRLI